MNQANAPQQAVEGTVTARRCECCGHHELGITTADGAYVPLKPGMRVRILHQDE